MEIPAQSKMNVSDERAVARAVGETFKNFINGVLPLTADNVGRLLYYNINPYATVQSFAMLQEICRYMREAE